MARTNFPLRFKALRNLTCAALAVMGLALAFSAPASAQPNQVCVTNKTRAPFDAHFGGGMLKIQPRDTQCCVRDCRQPVRVGFDMSHTSPTFLEHWLQEIALDRIFAFLKMTVPPGQPTLIEPFATLCSFEWVKGDYIEVIETRVFLRVESFV